MKKTKQHMLLIEHMDKKMQALKKADGGDYTSLLAFAKS